MTYDPTRKYLRISRENYLQNYQLPRINRGKGRIGNLRMDGVEEDIEPRKLDNCNTDRKEETS